MVLAALFLVLFSVSVLIEDTQANKYGLSKRFFFDELVGALSKEECILCKCYKQCHARDFNLNEGDVCADYEDSIDCSEIDRCTCCNELFIYQACLNGGSCYNIGNGDFTCICPRGTHGKRCEHGVPQVQQTDLCASAPCQNSGHCINGKSGYTCQCTGAWTGHNCETDLNIGTHSNHCASNPCQNGAVCNEGTNTYTCQCPNGWTGKNCDTHVDLCSSCQNGKCVHNNGIYSCSCDKGWKGNYCQTDVNECDLDACKHGSACTNTPGNFTCSCTSGWSGNQCDLDIDECLSQPCKNGSTCQNTDGFFGCACANGWTGFDCGTDIDECSMFHICHNGATCKNTLGHFTCTCLSGWTGTQCHNDIDECTSNPCLHGSTCINTPGSYSCNCLAGWSGDLCQNAPQPADCDHVCTLRSVVRLSSIENVNAATCSSTGLHSSNEALPMQCCNLPNSASWKKGEKVMTLCNAGTPYLYATVAAFTNGVLEPDTAGVITGCLPQTEPGFMLIRQSCSSNPHVYHVNGTNINQLDNDPDNYYFVV